MRAGFTDEKVFDLGFSGAVSRRLQKEAKRRGMTVPEFIQWSVKAALDAGLVPPPKEGRVLPFEALKRASK